METIYLTRSPVFKDKDHISNISNSVCVMFELSKYVMSPYDLMHNIHSISSKCFQFIVIH